MEEKSAKDTKMIAQERRQRIFDADHTKFGKVMLTTVASLTVVDKIIK